MRGGNILASKEDIPSEANNPRKNRGSNRGSNSPQKYGFRPSGPPYKTYLLRGFSQGTSLGFEGGLLRDPSSGDLLRGPSQDV